MMEAMDRQRKFRQACGKFATGITVIMVKQGSEIHGMTANAFMSVSLDPLLVAVSVSKATKMHRCLSESDVSFTISILHSQQQTVAEVFGRPHQRLQSQPPLASVDGEFPIVRDPAAWFLCHKTQAIDAGDHTIVIGAVETFGEREHHPLIFYRGEYFSQLNPDQDEMLEFSLLER